MSSFTFTVHKPASIRYPQKLLNRLQEMLKQHDIARRKNVHASLVWVGEKRMARLQAAYRGKSAATNVLTFPYERVGDSYQTDIVLCRNVIAKDAKKRKVTLEQETTHLILHGLLHVLGFEHHTARGRMKMETLEQMLLEDIFGRSFKDLHGISDGA
ncbi:MAG: rRNA maturation RNase YbeY [Parcubacteria group bacterium CG08_land_8_20_14_0_20_48_21]|nr:MAG: rRNA maturation RNase YbeY [Parcubacteria group bacterium CG2_30_48_51]PIS33250.1 MAG: rRNA maturation RNase YbeY [Parcubacteria group bacterium CG08_land_8_20_14_0_20_48_21]PIW79053.1 MAG: rRNA maturation RNase YbeY [Parcubacteria group bacterium CG_4_8_14_3_um_filter_48_16]PIY78131.1 MAG: rRNA maturation RNase YbeY [Parcubacteria group bacterium CG_4_10_14_0_8_um_filter_48_154]PIZ77058.1 MAG: rRNA maturation RNase YbeY [bacterium CG_4_10_14_0_2_um_filter_48_144]PJC39473.1 MAG: rRNA m